ncbi:MAG TPA: beta-galactosidase GalB [Bacteroidota bacterium]|nr:beta-galactosidase GalB [Bacteroidota bacterium]
MSSLPQCHAPVLVLVAAAMLIAPVTARAGSRTPFDRGWLFARFGPMPDGSVKQEPPRQEATDLDDSPWRSLDLPHDWAIEGPFRDDLPASTGKLPWAGIGWYRKHFVLPGAAKGTRWFIDFDGAMSHAEVWLNGRALGGWPYGYASFRLELKGAVEGTNVIAVRLDNPPNSSRWYPGGGIYRHVWLVRTGPVHVAHWGTAITTSGGPGTARVEISTEIENQDAAPASVTVATEICLEGTGAVVARASDVSLTVPGGARAMARAGATIRDVLLWDTDAPNMYVARTIVRRDGSAVDSSSNAFGVRTAVFTPDGGFMLNGKHVRINGVCDHHDLGPLGTAVNASALQRQIRILREMGCNAIRTSHNPPAPELLDLCDRMGMLVLDEAFDCWVRGKTPNDYSTLFEAWHAKDIRALVRRDRNHPSVIAWSAGNEVWEQNDDHIIRALRSIFRTEDTTRPVTSACNGTDAGFDGFQNAVDIFGYNYKPHMYEAFHEANPGKPLFGSETGSCVSTNGEYFFPVSDDKSHGFFDTQVSSYDLYAPPWATIPDVEFAAQDRDPYVAGEFVWTGFDYLGEPTPYGEDDSPARSSYFGIIDLCGFPKDRFYLYQAHWRPDLPMAHILPHWNWPGRAGKVTPVHVYTSGDEAELFLNGRSLGRKSRGAFEYRLRWNNVLYEPGTLRVVAYKNGNVWAEDSMVTTGPAGRITLTPERAALNPERDDLGFITAQIVDGRGRRVPTASDTLRFTVTGAGSLAATGNGDPTDHTSFRSSACRAFHGRCLVIVRPQGGVAGQVHVTATGAGLEGTSCTIALETGH